MFKRLREALERALEAATPPPELGQIASQMREAVIEQKAAVRELQQSLAGAEQQLVAEREQLETAQRRRAQAEGIADAETVAVAEKFIARHTERAQVMEQKVAAQKQELALAERDLAEMTAQLQEAARRAPAAGQRSAGEAWRSLGEAGMSRPETDLEGEMLKSRMDHAEREAVADQKLEELKKKMGR